MKLYSSRLNLPALIIATDYGLESMPLLFVIDGVAHIGTAHKDDAEKMKSHGADCPINEGLYWSSHNTATLYYEEDIINSEVFWDYLPENVKIPDP